MKIKKLELSKVPHLLNPNLLILFKPLGGVLHRCYQIPLYLDEAARKETIQVLNTLCTVYKENVWYFKKIGPEELTDISEIFLHMGIMMAECQIDAVEENSN